MNRGAIDPSEYAHPRTPRARRRRYERAEVLMIFGGGLKQLPESVPSVVFRTVLLDRFEGPIIVE